jgi:hypothetical protein
MPGFYATDMTTLFTGDTAVTTVESTISGYTNTVALNGTDPDIYLQGTAALSATSGTNKTGVCTILYNRGSALQINGGNVLAMWTVWPVPSGLGTFGTTAGGVTVLVGTAQNSLDSYVVSGSDVDPIGGWQQYVVDLRNTNTGALSGGSATETNQYYGIGYEQVVTFSKNQLFALDVTRYGRMTFSATAGTSTSVSYSDPLASTAANFPQMSYYDEWNGGSNPQLSGTSIGSSVDGGYHKLGQLQYSAGVYIAKGIISLGTSGTAVYFDDANRTINFKDEFLTYSDFNRLEIRNSGSTIKFDAMSFNFVPRNSIITAADAPATPRGNLEMFNDATILWDGCTFVDMGTFKFLAGQSGSYVNNTTFRRCDQVTVAPSTGAGMSFNNSSFINSNDTTGAILITSADGMTNLSNCNFSDTTSGAYVHILITGAYSTDSQNPTQFSFNGHQFTGVVPASSKYAVEFAGTGFIDINPSNGCNIQQSWVTSTGGGTATVQTPSVNFTVNNIVYNSEVRLFKASDDSEIAGVENIGVSSPSNGTVSGPDANGRYSFTISHKLNEDINIVLLSISDLGSTPKSYQPFFYTYTLSSAAADSFFASQVLDRQYANP